MQVIQAGFRIVVVATVAEGVDVGNIRRCNIFGILAVDLYDLTPFIISICGCQLAGGGIGEGYCYSRLQQILFMHIEISAITPPTTTAAKKDNCTIPEILSTYELTSISSELLNSGIS